MKILLIYPNIVESPKDISIGLGIISSILKNNNHEVELIDTTFKKPSKEEIISKVKAFEPELIAISAATNNLRYAKSIAKLIKDNFKVEIVFGGYHPTVAPQDLIELPFVDTVVIGEGEETILELANNKPKIRIKGIWYKRNKFIIKNPLRKLKDNLDELPFPDRNIFNYQQYIDRNRGLATFITSRGCPFQCSYCINKVLMNKFTGKYVRFRSPENIIKEIKEVTTKYKVKEIEFYDDTFTLNKENIKEFCELYKKEINIPFNINARVNAVDKETFQELKKAGCIRVSIGIESGDEHIRNIILKRNMTNEQIKQTFQDAKEAGLKTYSFNMIGIPEETKETINKTIELNQEIQPDFVGVSIFNAFKGTELYDYSKKHNLLNETNATSYFQSTNIKHPNFTIEELKNIRDTFGFKVYKKSKPLRAYIDLLDKRLTKYETFTKLRSKLIKLGAKKILWYQS